MQNVLWLCSWYPNELLPFEGDFIQRHARAVSICCNVHVIYAIRDVKGVITKDVEVREIVDGNLKETIIYYYSRTLIPKLLDKYLSLLKFKRVFKNAINKYLIADGNPDLIHVHTGMKAGLPAMWLSRKIKTPYVVTEHWTGFLPEAKESYQDLSAHVKYNWKKLIQNAAGISAVSSYLAGSIKELLNTRVPVIIPNVVDVSVFSPSSSQQKQKGRFIHISGLDFQKNPSHILEALAILKKSAYSFSLDVFGPEKKELKLLAKELDLFAEVHFYEEVPQKVLSGYLQQADALILYSRYETFGCVIIEANACGVPVIVSDIPVMREIVEENKNGILIKGEDPQALAERLIDFINGNLRFDSFAISSTTMAKYNYEKIGEEFFEWYKQVLNNKEEGE